MPTSEVEIIGGSTGFEPRIAPTGTGRPETIRRVLSALSHVRFPADSRGIADQVGHYPVPVQERELSIAEVVGALPPARFDNAAEVKEHLTAHWDVINEL